jgi:hypothetical protein
MTRQKTSPRLTTADAVRINASDLIKACIEKNPSVPPRDQLPDGNGLTVTLTTQHADSDEEHQWETRLYWVWRTGRFAKEEPFWQCPSCPKVVRSLYHLDDPTLGFRCQTCSNLAYPSQVRRPSRRRGRRIAIVFSANEDTASESPNGGEPDSPGHSIQDDASLLPPDEGDGARASMNRLSGEPPAKPQSPTSPQGRPRTKRAYHRRTPIHVNAHTLISDTEAYCVRCRRIRELVNITVGLNKKGRHNMCGRCYYCGTKANRIISAAELSRLQETATIDPQVSETTTEEHSMTLAEYFGLRP